MGLTLLGGRAQTTDEDGVKGDSLRMAGPDEGRRRDGGDGPGGWARDPGRRTVGWMGMDTEKINDIVISSPSVEQPLWVR